MVGDPDTIRTLVSEMPRKPRYRRMARLDPAILAVVRKASLLISEEAAAGESHCGSSKQEKGKAEQQL